MGETKRNEADAALLSELQATAALHGATLKGCPCPLHRGYLRLETADGHEVDTRELLVTED